MDAYTQLPDQPIADGGTVSAEFRRRGITTFQAACAYVHRLPYGYNSDRDDPMILFKEGKGSCTTKHAVIATLAEELGLPVVKTIGIYAMTETIVTGTQAILDTYDLPFIPMVHCFLAGEGVRVDLTEGNHNGKNIPIHDFLHTATVIPNISAKAEYLLYRLAVKDLIHHHADLKGVDMKTLLHAREEGIVLLRSKISD
ncbi:MAG: hypothetical protein P8010_03585 [Desulfosarcinaceae bacterium]|jgi:hypothetical protein